MGGFNLDRERMMSLVPNINNILSSGSGKLLRLDTRGIKNNASTSKLLDNKQISGHI